MEPTGPAWLPIAVFFISRGHVVYRVASAKAADLRRFLSGTPRPTASTPTRWPGCRCSTRPGCSRWSCPVPSAAALDRRVRATDRLTRAGAEHKTPDQGPGPPAAADDPADRRARRRRPRRAGTLGRPEPAGQGWASSGSPAIIAKASNGHHGIERAARVDRRRRAPRSSSTPATPRSRSPTWPPRSPPRSGCCAPSRPSSPPTPPNARPPTGGSTPPAWPAACPASPTSAAPPSWPPWATRPGSARGKQFRSFTGLVPKASETGDTDRKGQPMSKAGSSLLRTTLVRAADNARKHDPQLARIYYVQMVERGKDHLGALCVVAANLAERFWAVMNRGMPYVICDTDGTPGRPPTRPRPSSPSTGPCPPTSAPAAAARRWGRPPKPSRRDDINGATFPTTHRRALTPTRSTRLSPQARQRIA